MPLHSAARLIESAASRLAGFPNAELDAELLFRGVSGWSRAAILSGGPESVPAAIITAFEAAVARREAREPVQYILGRAAFWRDEFVVNQAVLIPRPETELLVEAVALRLRAHQNPAVLDVGTGSGCIALSLLRELDRAQAVAVDVSAEALSVARQNAERLGLESRVEFRRSDWFSSIPPNERFDAIVSNPPYVARADEASLQDDVRKFEPALALFAEDDDDLSSYRRIVVGAAERLKGNGFAAFEVGMGQAQRVGSLVSASGLGSLEILEDLAGIPRVVIGRRG